MPREATRVGSSEFLETLLHRVNKKAEEIIEDKQITDI